MKVSPLKNIIRREIRDLNGKVISWEILDSSGNAIPSCSLYISKLQGYSFATKKRYVEVVSKFVDYLYECRVLGCFSDNDELPTRKFINDAIDSYVPFLLRGSANSINFIISDELSEGANLWKIKVYKSLDVEPCKRSSLDNVIAAINKFLRISEAFSIEAQEMAEYLGVQLPKEYTPLINTVDGFSNISSHQRAVIRSASLMGGVLRLHGSIQRPVGISSSSKKFQSDQKSKDFPVKYMEDLLDAATSWRDKTLWLLLLASGIRKSEALNLQWSDIDYINRRVYVLDPHSRRYGRFMTPDENARFKGRTVSWTYLWEPWRSKFFGALEQYKKREWRLPSDDNQYVFQKLKLQKGKVGVPLALASDAAEKQSFERAVINAAIPTSNLQGNKRWTPHSLRHAYGVYMLNYIPIAPGVFGLSEVDVQSLMGHKSINTTRQYARRKEDVLLEKLRFADQKIMESMSITLTELPELLLKNVNTHLINSEGIY